MRRVTRWTWCVTALALAGCGGGGDPAPGGPATAGDAGALTTDAPAADVYDAGPPPPALRMLVDGNRDGVVDDRDYPHRGRWDAQHGAVFLANLDDDDGDHAVDGDDQAVNGDDDALDLARVRVPAWPGAPEGATATIALEADGAPGIHLFRHSGEAWAPFDPAAATLSAEDLRAGVELGVESTALPTQDWDGTIALRLAVTREGAEVATDRVVLRAAPWVISSSLDPTLRIFGPEAPGFAAVQFFTDDLVAAANKDAMELTLINTYRAPYRTPMQGPDVWMQDIMEFGWTAMPAADNAHHGMHVVLRTPAQQRPMASYTQRELLGPNLGYVWKYTTRLMNGSAWDPSLDSFGNLEVLPPYRNGDRVYPFGRTVHGSTEERHGDRALRAFLEAQRVQGPVFELDTSWLHVGHVDEFLSFIPAETPRGWRLLVASPRKARQLFTEFVARDPANASLPIFEGQSFYYFSGPREGQAYSAQRTVRALLADAALMATNERVQALIDTEAQKIAEEVGLAAEDIVELPILFMNVDRGRVGALMPGTVNLLFYGRTAVMARPHGVYDNDVDIVEQANIDALAPYGITVRFAEQWDILHAAQGEVHCGTNAQRAIPTRWQWWEAVR